MMEKVAIVTLLCLSSAAAFYAGDSSVVELSPKNWNAVFQDTSIWMLEFYAPWCGHCRNLAPAYKKAAENVDGLVKMGAVNCDEEQNKPICSQFGIQGFPTLKVLPWDATKARAASQANDYQGARSAAAIAKHLLSMMPNHVTKLGGKKDDKFFASDLKKVILFSSKKTTSNLYKGLAMQYKNRLAFGQSTLDSDLATQLGVTENPTLLVVEGGADATADDAVVYDGKLKVRQLHKFLSAHAPALKKSKKSASGNDDEPEKEEVRVPKQPDQEELWRIASTDDYTKHCVERAGTCVIGLLDPEGDGFEEYQKALEQVLESQKGGSYTVTWLDAWTQEGFMKQLGLYGQDLPRLIVVNDGKRAWSKYVGPFDGARINKFLGELKTGRSVQKLREGVDVGKPLIAENLKTEL